MRRDLREGINEEIDKAMQGLITHFKQAEWENNPKKMGVGPLSSRLRKRKLNSA